MDFSFPPDDFDIVVCTGSSGKVVSTDERFTRPDPNRCIPHDEA
jgi:hypothetical protein